MNGKLWSRKADLAGKKALCVMRLKIEKMVEKEERKCICPIHEIIVKNFQKKLKPSKENVVNRGKEESNCEKEEMSCT